MPNTKKNMAIGSFLSGPVNPFQVRLPHTDCGGICDRTAGVTVNSPIPLGGSYIKNLSTDTFSADLRLPICPVITVQANSDTYTLEIVGYDHLGRGPFTEIVSKTGTGNQTECSGLIAWSKILRITPRAANVPGNRLRIGFNYSTRGVVGGVDLASQLVDAAQVGAGRRLPLPFIPKSTSDIDVRFLGTSPNVSDIITKTPRADTLTFTTTGVTASAWTVSGIAAGDVAYTLDGYMGEVVSAAANAIVVTAWWRDGVAGTPGLAGSIVGGTNKVPWVWVVRHSVQTYSTLLIVGGPSQYSLTQGGLEPGARVMPLGPTTPRTGADVAGVHLSSATFGFLPSLNSESAFDTLFEVTARVGTTY